MNKYPVQVVITSQYVSSKTVELNYYVDPDLVLDSLV